MKGEYISIETAKIMEEIEKENRKLQDIIDKAIKYIWSTKYEFGDLEQDYEDFAIDVYKLLEILEGDNNANN